MEIYRRAVQATSCWTIDETGSIGKRYRREDEIGTPFCITVDFDTVGDGRIPATSASPSGRGTAWSRCVFPSAS